MSTHPPTTVHGVNGQNGAHAIIVNNFNYCCDGRGCRRCRPSRSRFDWWFVSLWNRYQNHRLNDLETRVTELKKANMDLVAANTTLTERVDALENNEDMNDAVNAAVDARFREWTATNGTAVITTMAEVLATFRPSRFWSRLLGTLGAVVGVLFALAYVFANRPATWYPLEPGWADTLLLNDNGYMWIFVIIGACVGGWLASRVGHWMDDNNNEERRTALLAQAQQAAIARVNAGV